MTSDVVVWCLPLEVLQTCLVGRRPRGRPWAGGITCLIYPGNDSRLARRDQKMLQGRRMCRIPCLRFAIQLWTNRRRHGWVGVIKHATWYTFGRDNLLEAKEKVACLFTERLLKWKDSYEPLKLLMFFISYAGCCKGHYLIIMLILACPVNITSKVHLCSGYLRGLVLPLYACYNTVTLAFSWLR